MTRNECYIAGRKIIPRGIMVHSTGANNPRISRYVGPDDGILGKNLYNNHWNQPMTRRVCVHGFIGKLADGTVATYQTLPWNHRAWHAGGAANDTHISFEICEDGLTNPDYFHAVYKEAVELCVHLCKLYPTIDPNNIIGHYEGHQRGIASNHGDPRNWFPKFGKSMATFRADVKALLGGKEIEAKMNLTGKTVKVRTVYGGGISLWSTVNKSDKLISVADGESVLVLSDLSPDTSTGWVNAEYKGVKGYADKRYLVVESVIEPTKPVEPSPEMVQVPRALIQEIIKKLEGVL